MARRVVESGPTGETFTFDDDWNDAEGRVHRMEFTIAPKSHVPTHAHPDTVETFEVISGVLSVKLGDRTAHLGPGERDVTKPGEAHSLWNEGTEVAHVNTWYDPPLAIEPYFTVIPTAIGSKNPFKIAVLWSEFGEVTQPRGGVGAFVAVFGFLGRLVGLGGWYRRPLNQPKTP